MSTKNMLEQCSLLSIVAWAKAIIAYTILGHSNNHVLTRRKQKPTNFYSS